MAHPNVLSNDQITIAVTALDGWEVANGKLRRSIVFDNFASALGFMVRAGVLFDQRNHHPEWTNVYNRLTIDFITHDAVPNAGITQLDIDAATLVNDLLESGA